MHIRWITAFLDLPVHAAAVAEEFWRKVTATVASPRRGPDGAFATLRPADGNAFLRVQVLGDGAARVHLDLHVDDVAAAAGEAVRIGATVTACPDGYTVLRSPGGMPFCLVPHEGETTRPRPVTWPDAGRSLLDQVSLDIPAETFGPEAAFWSALTGWEHRAGRMPEFAFLTRPDAMPLRLLLQRLAADEVGPVRAHLDLAGDDMGAEAARHESLGAVVVRRGPHWVTLRDPAGLDYCVTARDPDTGLLP